MRQRDGRVHTLDGEDLVLLPPNDIGHGTDRDRGIAPRDPHPGVGEGGGNAASGGHVGRELSQTGGRIGHHRRSASETGTRAGFSREVPFPPQGETRRGRRILLLPRDDPWAILDELNAEPVKP